MEANMCVIKELSRFIKKGTSTFRDASKGRYHKESKEIIELKEEMFGKESRRSDDRQNVLKDRKAIEKDVRKSFDKLALRNG